MEDAKNPPVISVVMSVRNEEKCVRETVQSILEQTFQDWELIIVDDGSTDGTGAILGEFAGRDARVRILNGPKRGLTAALIAGCAEARGEYIARQDAGDQSVPDRLKKQLDLMRSDLQNVLVSCAVDVVGPAGEFLYAVPPGDGFARTALLNAKPSEMRSLAHHGTAFFRRDAYTKAGGYRPEFYLAQDLDLWVRMARLGDVTACTETLYRACRREGDLSGVYHAEQALLTTIIAAMRRLDPSAAQYQDMLRRAATIRPKALGRTTSRFRLADQRYFVARCLRAQKDPGYREYLRLCVRANPFHIKAWIARCDRAR